METDTIAIRHELMQSLSLSPSDIDGMRTSDVLIHYNILVEKQKHELRSHSKLPNADSKPKNG